MKRAFLAITMLLTVLVLAGCGDNGASAPLLVTTQILSDPNFDGDISKDQAGAFTVTQGNTQTILVGIDPATGSEFRGFLDFPLGGAGGVPINATISSAILDITIDDIFPLPLNSPIPIRIDLVSFQPPLQGNDFDVIILPALISTTITPPISQADIRRHVAVNITPLMVEAQRLGLTNLQLRILQQELGPGVPAVIQINDTTGINRGAQAPLLEVTYF